MGGASLSVTLITVADLCQDLGIVHLQRSSEASRKVGRRGKKAEFISQQIEASAVHPESGNH